MNFEEYCFLIGLMIVPFSFLFFPKIHFDKRFVLPFFILALIFGITGLVLHKPSSTAKPDLYLFLLCPLFSLSLLRIMLIIFHKIMKRDPKNPPKSMSLGSDGLDVDRIFYFLFMILSLSLPIGILAYFYN